MQVSLTRQLSLPGAYNVRDLGGYATQSGGMTRWRAMLRADSLHEVGPQQLQVLRDEGLRTVVDLRSLREIAAAPNPLARDGGVSYVHIPLFDGLAPIHLALEPSGAEPFSIGSRYRDAIDNCGMAVARAIQAIAAAEPGLVLFHCTAGKDRTGLVAALALSVAGVAEDVIVEDYALTATAARPLLEKLLLDASARGLNPERFAAVLESRPETMRQTLAYLNTRYGGPLGYLEQIGVDQAMRQQLAERLV